MSGSIGYENLAESATITPSSEAAGYDADNVADGLLHDAWKPSTGGDADIEFALTAADNAGYLGIAGHTLGNNGARAQLQYGDGTDWFAAGYTVADPAGAQHVLAPSGSEVVYRNIGVLAENRLKYATGVGGTGWNTGCAASWTLTENNAQAPDGTYTATSIVGTSAGGCLNQGFITGGNKIADYVLLSCYCKKGDAGTTQFGLNCYDGGSNAAYWALGQSSITFSSTGGTVTAYGADDIGNGWYRPWVLVPTSAFDVGTSVTAFIYPQNNTAATVYVWGAQAETASAATATPGALVPTVSEPVIAGAADWRVKFYSQQNLFTYSEQFDNAAWTKTRSNVTANATTAPDGTATADKLYDDATAANTHTIVQSQTASTGDWVTFSVYCKAGEYDRVRLQLNSSLTGGLAYSARFDLSAGTVVSESGDGVYADIDSSGDGWFRCSIGLYVISGGTATGWVFLDDGTGITYDGDGSSGVYLWGAQLETAPSAGPYQVTTSAAVTDNDIGQVAVLAFGAPYDLPTGFRPGFARPGVWDAAESDNSISQGGLFVGRSVTKLPQGFTIAQDVADETALTNWAAFVERAKTAPFFFDWDNAGTNPVFAWSLDPGADAPRYQTAQYLQFAMDCEGLSET